MSEPFPIVAILRHAEYHQPEGMPSAWLPYPLTDEGMGQARQAAEEILAFARSRDSVIDPQVDCSRMLRAWQTASAIASRLELGTVAEFSSLAERSVGAVANLTTSAIEALMEADPRYEVPSKGWKSSTDYRLPFQGAESLAEAGERVAAHISTCMSPSDAGSVKVVVGHGASFRHAAMHLGLLSRDTVASVSMYHARPIFIGRKEEKWQILAGEWKPRKGFESDEYGVS